VLTEWALGAPSKQNNCFNFVAYTVISLAPLCVTHEATVGWDCFIGQVPPPSVNKGFRLNRNVSGTFLGSPASTPPDATTHTGAGE
jgi:hypothetical protein